MKTMKTIGAAQIILLLRNLFGIEYYLLKELIDKIMYTLIDLSRVNMK